MFTRQALAAIVAAAAILAPAITNASATFVMTADEIGFATHGTPSSVTHERVDAELRDAKAAGLVTYGEQEYPPAVAERASKTRAQVRAELDAARGAGQVTFGELDYPAPSAG